MYVKKETKQTKKTHIYKYVYEEENKANNKQHTHT
jgi:hypothetical protein